MLMRLKISFHRILWKYIWILQQKSTTVAMITDAVVYGSSFPLAFGFFFVYAFRVPCSLHWLLVPLLSFPFVCFSEALFSKLKSVYDMFWSFCVANLENFPTQNDNNHSHMNYMCSLYFVLVWYVVIWKYSNKISDETYNTIACSHTAYIRKYSNDKKRNRKKEIVWDFNLNSTKNYITPNTKWKNAQT